MQAHYSTAELTTFDLSGLPATARSISRRATKENWPHINQPVKGGYEKRYLSQLLPKAIKEQLALAELKPLDLVPSPEVTKSLVKAEDNHLPAINDLKEWQRNVMNARQVILRAIDELEKVYGTNNAIATLISRVKENNLPDNMAYLNTVIPAANARGGKSGKRTLSRTSIYRWRKELKKGGTALAPATVEKSDIPAWAPYFIESYNRPQKPSIPAALEEMRDILPKGMIMPSCSQVRYFNNKRSRLDRQKGRKSGSELDAHKGYRIRDTSNMLPLDVGVCDGHSFKARIAHPVHGQPFHPEVCGVIDGVSKVCTGWSAGLAESAETVADAVRHSATTNEKKPEGGVYGILYTDGGSGNRANVNTDEMYGRFPRLGTKWEKGIPGNAKGHGLIEILNKSLWIRGAKKLATYTGKDMDKLSARKVYLLVNKEIKETGKSKLLLSWPDFLTFCQNEVDAYNRRPHSALPKVIDPKDGRRRHMCPLEMWSWHMNQGWLPEEHQLDEGEVEALMMPRKAATVRNNQVQLFTNTYYHKDLVHYNGERLQVEYDVHDGSKVRVWDKEGRMICYAFFEKNKSDYFPMAAIEKAREDRAKRRTKIKEDQILEINAERRVVVDIDNMRQDQDEMEELLDDISQERQIEAATVEKKKKKGIVPIFATMTERYQFVRDRDRKGSLTIVEVEFLDEFYQTRLGSTFIDLEGDLREKYGFAEAVAKES